MKFLVDECLSLALEAIAHDAGYEAYHVSRRGWSGLEDWQLLQEVQKGEYTFVTANVMDFRRLYKREFLHAGVVLLLRQDTIAVQRRLFEAVLQDITNEGDLVNTAVEADLDENDTVVVTRYRLP